MKQHKLIRKFNARAIVWLQDLQDFTFEELSINPGSGAWSMSELYDHIMKVARTYQIPNFHQSMTTNAKRKKRKNLVGVAVFDLGIRKQVKIKMEEFPAGLVADFTPVTRPKEELLADFSSFIKEVSDLEKYLMESTKHDIHYHPMFGDIKARDWFSLIEIHMSHHEVQRQRIATAIRN
ncbi:MAG: hypothetical protein WBA74_19125 [Cyclobacteriaceae bacterium]